MLLWDLFAHSAKRNEKVGCQRWFPTVLNATQNGDRQETVCCLVYMFRLLRDVDLDLGSAALSSSPRFYFRCINSYSGSFCVGLVLGALSAGGGEKGALKAADVRPLTVFVTEEYSAAERICYCVRRTV